MTNISREKRRKKMKKQDYNRVAEDKAQLNKFVDDVCENIEGGGNVSDLYLEINEEPTQAQLEQVYTQKPDVLRIGMGSDQHVVVLYKSMQSESETRLNYFNIQTSEGVVQVLKIEYSEDDGYLIEPYEWSLDELVDLGSTLQKMFDIGDLDGFLDNVGQYLINGGFITKLYRHEITVDNSHSGDMDTIKIINTNSEAYETLDSVWNAIIHQGNEFSVKYALFNDEFETSDRTVSYVDTETGDIVLSGGGSINKTWLTFVSDQVEEY